MIRRETENGWFFFTQDDHAKLSAQIMSLWGGGFFFPESAGELMFALSEHDCGWKTADCRPVLKPDGVPEDFTEVPPSRQCDIWRQSFNRNRDEHPDACVLIALHFNKFNERTLSRNPNKWSLSLREEIREFVTGVLNITSVERIPADTEKNLRLLQTGDAFSLALCHGWDSFEIGSVPLENGADATIKIRAVAENSYSVSPWPFSQSGRLDFETDFIRTREKRFDSNRQLAEKLNRNRKGKMNFSLLPGKT